MADMFSGSEHPISPRDMADEARREVDLRKRVYPRMIASGKLKEGAAARQIAVMQAIADKLSIEASGGGRSGR